MNVLNLSRAILLCHLSDLKLLNIVQILLLRLAVEHQIVVITVNVLTSQPDQPKHEVTPALSKYWTPSVRIMMKNHQDRKVLIVKNSPKIEEGSHNYVKITNAGVI
jgi:hypothetical protein